MGKLYLLKRNSAGSKGVKNSFSWICFSGDSVHFSDTKLEIFG